MVNVRTFFCQRPPISALACSVIPPWCTTFDAVHGQGCVQIILKELDSPVPGYQHTILTYLVQNLQAGKCTCCCTISCSITSFYSSLFCEGRSVILNLIFVFGLLIYFTCQMFSLMFISWRFYFRIYQVIIENVGIMSSIIYGDFILTVLVYSSVNTHLAPCRYQVLW